MNFKKMCMMFMVLSPNCCAVIKQMAECRFRPRKTSEEEEKCVASAIAR